MIHFLPLSPLDLTEEDAEHLVKISAAGYGMESGSGLLRRALAGRLTFWRVSGDAEGLLVTKVTHNIRGRCLWLEGVSGKGFVAGRYAFRDAMVDLARSLSCTNLSGLVFRKGMRKMIEDTELPEVGLVFSKEVA